MEFVSMDLIGEFHPPSSKGNRYALTAVCMLCRLHISHTHQEQKNKSPEEIVDITFPFGVCRKLLMDNSTKFLKMIYFPGLQNNLELKEKFIHLHTDQNQMVKIEGFHKFLKKLSS